MQKSLEPAPRRTAGRGLAGALLGALFALALVPLGVAAEDHAHMDHGPSLGASAVITPAGVLWVASVKDGHVLLRRSEDFGAHFAAPVRVNVAAEDVYATGEYAPKVASGPGETLHVAWTVKPVAGWTGDIRYARSTDGGKTFSAPLTVNRERTPVMRGFTSLAVDATGNVVVAWIDAGDAERAHAEGKEPVGFSIRRARSDDGGASFGAGERWLEHSCECCRTTLVADAGGGFVAFVRGVFGDNIRDHALLALDAAGKAAPPARATFSNWQIPACPDHGPGLAVGADGTRHGVWYEASSGPAIWYGQLHADAPPSHRVRLAGAGAGHADVTVTGATVRVAWLQVSAAGYALQVRRSDDGGASFGAPETVATSSVAAGSPQWLTHAGRAWLGWNTLDGYRVVPVDAAAAETVTALDAAGVAGLVAPPAHGLRLVMLWSLDCAYCEPNMEALAALQRARPDAVELVTVATDSVGRSDAIAGRLRAAGMAGYRARAYAEAVPMRLNFLVDPAWGGELPRTLVIYPDGTRHAASGLLSPERLEKLIAR